MAAYEEELYGVEDDDDDDDDFDSQFAAELEVLAELDGDPTPPAPKVSWRRKRKPVTFEEALAAGDVGHGDHGPGRDRDGSTGVSGQDQREPVEVEEEDPLTLVPFTPKPKRRKLETVKKLDFGLALETSCSGPLQGDITPPLTPEDPAREPDGRPTDRDWSPGPLEMSDVAPLQRTPSPRASRRGVLRRPPVLDDYINVTSTDGTRVYLVMKDDPLGAREELVNPDISWRGHRQLHLLGVPFSHLKEQVANERRRRVLEGSQQLTDLLNSLDAPSPGAPAPGPGSAVMAEEEEEQEEEEESSMNSLWVDRFTPQRYTDLLSDDYTNRCLLKWLKLWDLVVFGREKPAKRAKPVAEPRAPAKAAREQQGKWKSKEQLTEEILEAELDQTKRPKHKVALLCGPPGLGKTTLAHVIAKHAGYNVVEMNASDDRSPDIFKTRIEAATQMKSVLGAHEKPNCLIIDEIDGAPTPAINVLLNILNRKDTKDVETASGGPGSRKRRREGGLLLRPIICICNDQFTPSLRQLRQHCFLLNFPQTQPSRLVHRLQEISALQGMKADVGALMTLCEKTENDIRSCINTLQFLHSRGKRELSVRMLQTMKVGLKDQKKGLFSLWQEIFQLPRVQRQRIGEDPSLAAQTLLGFADDPGQPGAKVPSHGTSHRFHHILHLTTSTGEHEKISQGLYENFLNMKLKDSSLGTVCLALDWLQFEDTLDRTVRHGQHFQLMRYLPFLPVAFHLLFAATSVPRIAYPSSQFEALSRKNQMQNLILSMVSGVTAAARSRAGPQVLVLEALCLLLDIISPKLRPINTQLYSSKEKQQLAGLISTMLSFNLTYLQERTADGQYVYTLDPNVEAVCRFPDLPARKQLTYQAKQLIAREIELEKMRRTEAALQARNPSQPAAGEKAGSGRNHEQRLKHIIQRAVVDEKPETDFFGRKIVRKAATPGPESRAAAEQDLGAKRIGKAVGHSDVWFRFNEGVSNAVRRSVYVRDLM
ncbi:chromosome transmission fidelity protein 18 homolog isoform X1 [Ornithorhynchus anatinus]|uniref:Chromosome transmission fidelity protein 18 homolog n=1 Tax=Ornithorhynchus anatinus TaxID=9258 RepID=A0A6I8PS36_ORNAN|nr:chromosome transmission fidelity protein 18 homolog isoform X1 [Ornithorhynchus anatinus]